MNPAVIGILCTVLGVLSGALVTSFTVGRKTGRHEKSLEDAVEKITDAATKIASIPQLEKNVLDLSASFFRFKEESSDRFDRLRSDHRELRQEVAVMNERKLNKETFQAVRQSYPDPSEVTR